ncbi:MAG: bifunctional hydroxymethylpyrimidine kinase/phosphomethylpyrimidine kinase, partial [Chthoniobacterales bacterium]
AGEEALDLLCTKTGTREYSAKFERGVQTHGTGCTYSAAIAAGLASGLELEPAIERAKRFVTSAIAHHFTWGNVHALNHSPRNDPELRSG